jgi:hypothetical protein
VFRRSPARREGVGGDYAMANLTVLSASRRIVFSSPVNGLIAEGLRAAVRAADCLLESRNASKRLLNGLASWMMMVRCEGVLEGRCVGPPILISAYPAEFGKRRGDGLKHGLRLK